MSYRLLSETYPVARKRHRCIWCGQHIEPGQKYRHERSVYEGQMQDHKWHPECEEQFGIECTYEGGTLEFSPHENERPALGVSAPDSKTIPVNTPQVRQSSNARDEKE